MKRRIIKIAVLTVVFILALAAGSLLMNRGSADEIVDMGAPALPRVSFTMNGETVNRLEGYVDDMDITAMRDTIIPLEKNGTLSMNLEEVDTEITRLQYDVYSMDGKEQYLEGEIGHITPDEPMTLELASALNDSVREAVLQIIVNMGEKKVNYYTRIVSPEQTAAADCLKFAKDFHSKALSGKADDLNIYLEPGDESDNTTYQTVNIHSDITHIQWGDLKPEVIGDIEWSVKESNSVYTSLLAKYQVSCEDDSGEAATYNIKEFFRVRISGDTTYLLDYNRDMEQIFSGNSPLIDEQGIIFGIASDDIQYVTNKDETMTAFVQERDLWLYDADSDELLQVFSFANREGRDGRSRNDQHAVRIISMENSGNMAFAVYGYMNRGLHEGQVGVGVYYFDKNTNAIEEKAFIPSTKSFAIAEDELGKMVYYNHGTEMLYVLAAGTLYQVDLDKDEQTVLAEDLEDGQYAVSEDGHLMAYQTEGALYTAKHIQVMNLTSGEEYTIDAADNEAVCPLGFMNEDIIYGKIHPDDKGTTASGEEIVPMYEVEIRNSENKSVAAYSFADDGVYTTDILIEGNLVTLNRVKKSGSVYSFTDQEYITNNEERKDSAVALENYTSERMQKQMRLTFKDGVKDTAPKVLRPNQLVSGKPLTITLGSTETGTRYYVYGMGELAGIYDKAGYAVQKAEQISGVVISSDQAYIWEKGNRDLVYSTEAEGFKKQADETSLEACERYMEKYNAKRVDLTGCTLEQVLYVINKGCPLIALTGADHAVLMTGYTKTDITYIDADTGDEKTVGINDMEDMVKGSGNAFIGYVK